MICGNPLLVAAFAGTFASLLCAGCDSARKPANTDATPASLTRTAPPQPASACEMVTPSEMSAILGVTVTAQDTTHSSGETVCTYSAASGFPTVQLEVDFGDGEAAMGAFALFNRQEPGSVSPYAGVGDQAVAIGPTLMIRTGDDLMKLVFSGVDDAPSVAKKMFQTAKPRLSP